MDGGRSVRLLGARVIVIAAIVAMGRGGHSADAPANIADCPERYRVRPQFRVKGQRLVRPPVWG